MSAHMRRISVFQAKRGIYLDLEGFKDKPPAIAGISIDSDFRQVVFDPVLKSAAEDKGLSMENLDSFIKGLQEECERNSRFIIAFSIFELNVIQNYCGIDISRCFKNSLRLAKRWKWKFHKDIELQRNSLDQFLTLPGINYEIPKHLGKGNATKRLKAVREMLERCGDYTKLTSTKKRQWTNLLEYNRHDVLGMQALTMRAAEDMRR